MDRYKYTARGIHAVLLFLRDFGPSLPTSKQAKRENKQRAYPYSRIAYIMQKCKKPPLSEGTTRTHTPRAQTPDSLSLLAFVLCIFYVIIAQSPVSASPASLMWLYIPLISHRPQPTTYTLY